MKRYNQKNKKLSFFQDPPAILIQGAGEIASGIAHRLFLIGFNIIMTEINKPLAIRRNVSYSETVYENTKTIEGVTAVLIKNSKQLKKIWDNKKLAVIVDPSMQCLKELNPEIIINATLRKTIPTIMLNMAPLTIGLGPGFYAPQHVNLVIETNRGHNLGRLIYSGKAEANTKIPGSINGYSIERVLRAPTKGQFKTICRLGESVIPKQIIGYVKNIPIVAPIKGILRGLLRSNFQVKTNFKIGDIDPRNKKEYLNSISEKARTIGGSVLEGIFANFNIFKSN